MTLRGLIDDGEVDEQESYCVVRKGSYAAP